RSAGRNLMEAVEEAQGRLDEALAIMGSLAGKVSGGSGLNPKALAILNEAQRDLSAAVDASGGAEEGLASLSRAVLARILALQGRYHAAVSAAAARDARSGLDLTAKSVFVLQVQANLAGYYAGLASVDMKKFEAIRAEADQQVADLAARQRKLDVQLRGLQKQYDDLLAANEALTGKVREVRRDVPASRGLEVLEQALEIEMQIDKNAAEAGQVERSINGVDAQKQELTAAMEASQKMVTAVAAVLDRGRTEAGTHAARKDEMSGAMAQTVQIIESQLGRAQAGYRRMGKSGSIATKAYQQAVQTLGESQKPTATEGRFAQQGEVHAAAAELHARNYFLMTQSARVAKAVSNAFTQIERSVPAAVGAVADFGRRSTQAKTDAVKHYSEAGKLYEKAASNARRTRSELTWVYQAELAAACIGHYRLSGDTAVLAKARKLLNEDLKGKDNAAIRQLRRVLQGESQSSS
ncbi:MAG: hypothetical protein KAX78_05730, partial [Phycisphaerae bacterium]|nr:hypothetical protein [Phycisphaerae bacterium]